MKTKWCDLFVLGLIQCAPQFNLVKMLNAINGHFYNACGKKSYKFYVFYLMKIFFRKAKK